MNYDIFIPVRLSNTRLPKKAMKEIDGKPIIKYLIERLQHAKKIRNIVVCTTNLQSDDPLVEFLKKEKIHVFRGSEKDVLVRFLDAANHFGTDFIVNVDGDDVYTDPAYVDKIINESEMTNADYINMKGFPLGFAPVGFKTVALKKICELKITNNTETGYRDFFIEANIFKVKTLEPDPSLKFPENLRLTLDYEEDLNLVKQVFKMLGNDFHLHDLLKLFEMHPHLLKITEGLDVRWKEHWDKNLADFSVKTT
jgi:spore coat polysaccharide biosynthesis protein SpsF